MTDADARVVWSCSHCGPHPQSRANWCAKGCGRDYQKMTQVPHEVVGHRIRDVLVLDVMSPHYMDFRLDLLALLEKHDVQKRADQSSGEGVSIEAALVALAQAERRNYPEGR